MTEPLAALELEPDVDDASMWQYGTLLAMAQILAGVAYA